VKVDVEEISSVKKKVRVEVPASVAKVEYDKAYQQLNKSVKLKGFRPGKVPRPILERYYGDRVRYDVTTKLIQDTYPKALEEQALTPVSQPEIEQVDLEPGEDFRYTAVVEIRPKIEAHDYLELNVSEEEVSVSEEEVTASLEELRERFGRLEDVQEARPTQRGDVVLVEEQILMDGESPADKVPGEQLIELAPDKVEDKFLEALIGVRPGEEIQVPHRFPAEHPDAQLAGKQTNLKLVVKRMQQKVLPELDDDFAKRLGEYDSLEQFKEKVRGDLLAAEQARVRSEVNESLVDQLIQRHAFEVPEAMVELQLEGMVRNAKRRLASQGLSLEQAGRTEEQLKAQYRDAAVRAVRSNLILEAVAAQEGLEVTDEDTEEGIQKIARQTGQPLEEIRKIYREPAARESLKENLLEEKTLDFLRDKATIKKEGKKNGSKKS
jgi:trigger factor